ncbi:hypothetical protein Pst134EA_023154 [Puccinia striiformis f. sp. tritici]|uniref:hypothetical protein n=1 Tax=Puccinia striiformis f. sp. tritici TaxID=168172 RepID=UPI0020075CED|nr:hypothetical protein Pst134EA_023154 [Puccinia striiformis f. sp. tritici]KAH9455698.1 hypothetical protein Pst134EA_023154 [Puccinia striiformis f. sp. tritici]
MELSTSIRRSIFLAVQLTLLVSPLLSAPVRLNELLSCGRSISRTDSMQAPVERPAWQKVPQLPEASTPEGIPYSDWPFNIPHGISRVGSRRSTGEMSKAGTMPKTDGMEAPVERPVLQEVERLRDVSAPENEPHSISESHLGNSHGSPRFVSEWPEGEISKEATSIGTKWLDSPRQLAGLYPLSLATTWTHKTFEEWLKTGHIPGSSSKEIHSVPPLDNELPHQETSSKASHVVQQQAMSI